MKTILKDRVLWYDGDVTFSPEQLLDYILNGGTISEKIHVDALNQDVINYNRLHPSLLINVKKDLKEFDYSWNIPEKYKAINIKKYVADKFSDYIESRSKKGKPLTENQINDRIDRIQEEFKLYEQNGMFVILKTVIYILDVFKENNVVWGTGRGSSCASYILYILGLHNVDSIEYELDLKEFFK